MNSPVAGLMHFPMLAATGEPFDSEDYLFEIKWDGIRAIAEVGKEKTSLYSRNGNDITHCYPELELRANVDRYPVILDGEIVVLKDGMPSFHTLQMRYHLKDPRKIRAAMQSIPAIYMVFDILHLGGQDLTKYELKRRKEILAETVKEGPHLLISQFVIGAGKQFFDLVKARGLEGIMAKRLDSPYLPGKRSNFWIKARNVKTMSCIICGYLQGERRELRSLILGAYRGSELIYVGNAGSGLDEQEISFLMGEFKKLQRNASPFALPPFRKGVFWVEPKLVCEISYLEKQEVLRHPTFLGLRWDLKPEDCRIEQGDSK